MTTDQSKSLVVRNNSMKTRESDIKTLLSYFRFIYRSESI